MWIIFLILTMYRYYIYHPDLVRPTRIKDPVGWDSLGKSIKRDRIWHGVFFAYTPKIKFIKDGKNLVHGLYELYGPEAELLLIITKYNAGTKKYEQEYTGRLNLYTITISTLYVECNVEQTGFTQKLKNRQEVKVNVSSLFTQDGNAIAANVEETQTVELHSKALRKETSTNKGFASAFNIPFPRGSSRYVMLQYDTFDFDELTERFDYETHISSLDPVEVKKYIFKMKEGGVFNINLDLQFIFTLDPANSETFTVQWYFVHGTEAKGYTSTEFFDDSDVGTSYSNTASYTNAALALEAGDEVYIYAILHISGSGTNGLHISDGGGLLTRNYDFIGDTVVPETNSPVVMWHEAFARIIESVTGESDSFRSNYYGRTDSEPTSYASDGEGSLRGFLNGSLIRGFPLANKPVHASLKDMLETAMAVDGVGLGIEKDPTNNKERARIEPLTYFYSPIRVAQFPFVADIQKEVAADHYFNELAAGYEKAMNETINNLDEFNAKRDFVLPLSQIKSRIILRSPYIASGHTIEFLRRDPYVKGSTKDNDLDNENFIIQLRREDGSFVTDKDEDFAVLTNLISPATTYNAKLSPMRNIMRNGSLIRGGLYHLEGKNITLSFGEANTDFTSRLTTETEEVSEKSIAVERLSVAIWKPEYYLFRYAPNREQWEAINANPYGYIEFSNTDRDWKRGYLLEAVPNAKDRMTEFKLLRANA